MEVILLEVGEEEEPGLKPRFWSNIQKTGQNSAFMCKTNSAKAFKPRTHKSTSYNHPRPYSSTTGRLKIYLIWQASFILIVIILIIRARLKKN